MGNSLKKINWKELFLHFIPYIIIIAVSIMACSVLFIEGFPSGDDTNFHFSNIYDMYLDLKDGTTSPISSTLGAGLGFGKRLFYSPFSHLSTVIIAIWLEPLGVSLLNALKINLFISVLISGIFMYRFGMHISKNKMIPALIAALIYIIFPYRYFDMICRIAIAEAYSFLFLPLFFMGLYDFVHIEDRKIGGMIPCLEIILGGSLLFLTHNITAIYSYFFGVIYLVFHARKIFYLLKYNKHLIIYAVVSAFLLLGIASKTLFSAYSLYQTGLYNVSIADRMWTNPEHLAASDFEWYSGFINFAYFESFDSGITRNSVILDTLFFSLLTIGFVFLDYIASIFLKKKYYHTPILMVISSVLAFFLASRTEVAFGILLFNVTYLFYVFSGSYKELNIVSALFFTILSIGFFILSCLIYKSVMYGIVILLCFIYAIVYSILYKKKKTCKLYKESHMDLYYLVFVHIITIVLIVGGNIWFIVPETLRSIQFSWRLYAFLGLFSSIIASEILKNFKKSYLAIAGLAGASFLFVCGEATTEKTTIYNIYKNYDLSKSWKYVIDDSKYPTWDAIGACKEYFPTMYYYSSDYKSEYGNSLYSRVKYVILHPELYKNGFKTAPVILNGGSGTIQLIKKEAPVCEFNLEVTSDEALIQIPFIYYPGYKIILENENGIIEVDASMIDGLISFKASKGTYKVTTEYVGTKVMKIGSIYQALAIPLTFGFASLAVFYDLKKKIKEENVLY